jgi:hypothetical protein
MASDHQYSPERLANEIETTRAIIRRAAQVLSDNPKPDTFAGRKTQGPFPKEGETVD